MKLLKNAVYFKELKLLALADLHVGYEASLIAGGALLPRLEEKEILEELGKIFEGLEKEKLKVKEIVICGDLKHKFGGFSLNEWKDVREVLDFLSEYGKVILLRGNHDSYLKALEDEYEVRNYYRKNKICFMHGDKLHKACLNKNVETVVVGHIHPVAVLREQAKQEKYKCFLIGKWGGKKAVVLPAFNPLIETGFDISKGIVEKVNLKKFRVYVVGDGVYKFGKVDNLS